MLDFSFHKFLQLPMSVLMKAAWCNGENTRLGKPGIHFFLFTTWPWKSHFAPSFLTCNMIILSAFLVRDVVRLERLGWNGMALLFPSHLPLFTSPLPPSPAPPSRLLGIPEFLYSYIWVSVSHFNSGMVFIMCCGGIPQNESVWKRTPSLKRNSWIHFKFKGSSIRAGTPYTCSIS